MASTSNGHVDGEPTTNGKFVEGLIYPPPEIRNIVDKTAAFVAKNANPTQFEEKMRARAKTDPRFSFINDADAYNAYYRHKISLIKTSSDKPASGSAPAASSTAQAAATPAAAAVAAEEKKPLSPPAPLEFSLDDLPPVNAVDLDIIRLTALFAARSGRRFTSDLSAREARNYQFDFLRPSHSLFPVFNRLVEQYTKVLIPREGVVERLEKLSGGKAGVEESEGERKEREARARREVLAEVGKRVEWERFEGKRRKALQDEEEAERIAFAEIDWQDFTVASTVEFTDQDQVIELPPPMSVREVENMTIAQKRMAAMIMEGKDVEEAQLDEAADAAEADEILAETRKAAELAKREAALGGDVDEDERPKQQATEIKKATATAPAGMKIRKDYVPKSKQAAGKVVTTLCQICGQLVPVEEIGEHVRIELLDPRWKEKKRATEVNRSAAGMVGTGADVSASLRELAKQRTDIFTENVTEDEKRRREEERERERKAARDKYTWDGHLNTGDRIQGAYQSTANLDEQIEALHRAKGLTGEQAALVGPGPQMGPNGAPMQMPASSMAAPPPTGMVSFGGGATLSAGPQPISSSAPRMPPPMDPARAAMMGLPVQQPAPTPGLSQPPPQPGPPLPMPPAPQSFVRPATDVPEGQPEAKRARTSTNQHEPAAQPVFTEQQWLDMHPNQSITLIIRLPVYEAKPEWGCDGSDVRLDELPLTLFCGTLRDRLQHLKGIPINRQQFRLGSRILPNQATLAAQNLGDGDSVTLQIREGKKK